MELGNQIKKYRSELQISQEQLADRIYVSRQTISNWENEKSYPDVNSLILLSEVFQTSIDKLIKGDIEIMKEKQIECNFDEKFSFFDESKNICDTLREVNSFARMQRPLENMSVKREMYRDAIKILLKDVKAEDEDVDKILADNIPNKKNKNNNNLN